MKFSEVKESILSTAMAGYVPFIRGLHGIGKSDMMKSIADEISVKKGVDVTFHQVDVSHIKEGELTGMPITGKDSDTGCMVNTYTLYNLFNEVIKESEEGFTPVIFFDEINRADRVVFNELMPIILNKRVQETVLPENTVILAAGNPEDISKYNGATDDYSVLPMDPALKDRFFIYELDVDPVEWLHWAIQKNSQDEVNIHQDIVEFISEFPNMLHFLSKAEINPTPRAWKMFSDVYKAIGFSETTENLVISIGSGKIGTDTILNFVRFVKNNKNPLMKPKDFFGVSEEVFKANLNKIASDTPTRQYISMANITEYYYKKLPDAKNQKDKDKLVGTYCEILWKMPQDILIGSLKEMLTVNKKALNEITKRDPKKVTEVQKYLI